MGGNGLISTVTGALDAAALKTDEAVGRTFDSRKGGGVWDGFAGTLDAASLKTDEAVGRTFDSREGGGIVAAGRQAAQKAVNIGPDWLDEATGAGLVAVLLAVLAYLFGQLFDIQL